MDSLSLKSSVFEVARPRLAGLRRRRSVSLRVAAQAEPDLSIKVNGLEMPNPFVIGSGPPGTNYTVMKRAFDEGWGAVIAKTVQFLYLFFYKFLLFLFLKILFSTIFMRFWISTSIWKNYIYLWDLDYNLKWIWSYGNMQIY